MAIDASGFKAAAQIIQDRNLHYARGDNAILGLDDEWTPIAFHAFNGLSPLAAAGALQEIRDSGSLQKEYLGRPLSADDKTAVTGLIDELVRILKG